MSTRTDAHPVQEPALREHIELRVRRVLGELFQLHADELSLETSFDELGADSADFVELQILLLEEFGLEIPERSAQTIRAVNELVAFLHDRLSAASE